ncbi:conserved Plasmodium protein, unknown function [Plasmodium knowlesi strain H]|uniref:Uncharacterized protein n=3 Tax=Plasmodium knowlesi TaxID=5850 RepID=A0A5K1VCY0_PLAKH|nr:conserved Plasmodium protein, unknown function [Plasmodium knowlesi strain H]OTN66797.1 Uncharacterized protein PKNOH_S08475400 [Plasmodium knowlesi]CAA9990079.1 conserved Plasmodium protein, unknown function [Plasmodium knowlesi strain H]SBO25744.1 conserved Plasmodium protein, unknown function [Plasmodium knowlesi strain H]SBO28551.1 conserved Plasmodium protein, unknown function [Plasmodium knowlesi strain H]VVS79553.1 conserved Plasmodium protein, unknown function [Plasmodium knowlesi s|eukprot:XP_002260546.1 hypothetical protein, conserved in Plasmodium species [Plasmodium knowlesi strain H]
MIRKKWPSNERVVKPIVSKGYISPLSIKNVKELKEELKNKIYTNIYTFNTLCDGIYISRGIYAITGRRNTGKSSLCAHICVNLFFNDILHYFHLFYSSFFDFLQFLEEKNVESKFCLQTANRLSEVGTEFSLGYKSFNDFKQMVRYFSAQFVQLQGGKDNGVSVSGGHINCPCGSGRQGDEDDQREERYLKEECFERFSKRRAIYLDLDNSFYMERYKNMIHASLEKIKKLMNTYKQFCSEKKCSCFMLLLQSDKQLRNFLSPLRKKYSASYDSLIDIFNHHMEKYINRITFSDVYKNFQLLKIFNFGELVNVVNFISSELQKYEQPCSKYLSRYVPPDLGVLVVDNMNYLYKEGSHGKNKWNSELSELLKTLSKLSTENKVCVLVTNNDNKYFSKKEEWFFHLYSKYAYSHVLLKFINEKKLFNFNSFPKGKINALREHRRGNRNESLHVKSSVIKDDNTYHNRGRDGNENSTSSEESFNELSRNADADEGKASDDKNPGDYDEESDEEEDAKDAFFKKRYNLRYIKIKRKKKKTELCFFQINEFGIETILV